MRPCLGLLLLVVLGISMPVWAANPRLLARLQALDGAVEEAIRNQEIPGAVVVVGHQGEIIWRRAYGYRALRPRLLPMTPDTVFDIASLTKPVATATALMVLVDAGKVDLEAPVSRYLPEFAQGGKGLITVRHLLVHGSGLRDTPASDFKNGPAQAFEHLYRQRVGRVGQFHYTDTNYLILGQLVARVAGMPLERLVRDRVFRPLGMDDTGYGSPPSLRVAPTSPTGGTAVHDPKARLLGGVAGNAGVYSTADDLAHFCQMLLDRGQTKGHLFLSPQTVERMLTPYIFPDGKRRALGWDIDTPYATAPRGTFPLGSFGHTGYTGTSLWIDPGSQSFVILLSNRVHLSNGGNVKPLRQRVATIVADALYARNQPVLTGLDTLVEQGFAPLAGRHLGLITNRTGVSRTGARNIDLLRAAPEVTLVALFSPEHGLGAEQDTKLGDSYDLLTHLPIYSLYGTRDRPSLSTLQGIDTLVYDIQDIGTRFYTYLTTLGYMLETCARYHLTCVVLDRPNPLTGTRIEGILPDPEKLGFTAYYPLPVRYGMTAGELASFFNHERKLGADLRVIPMAGWRRDLWYDQTGLGWVNPSPNIRNLTEALLYPGIGTLEATNLSVGRGTATPFEVVGAPWIDGPRLSSQLNALSLSGVHFSPVTFTPSASTYRGQVCQGVHLEISDREHFEPIRTGIEIALQLRSYPQWEGAKFDRLLRNARFQEDFKAAASAQVLLAKYSMELEAFKIRRQNYLLYP
ncbi:exo-beta-N-acetylmuramidase NamZ domain-containing protein [Anthocerotibacter panamensis]|uniref:exo-beta-N-acetylmuramidase NamZ domain-containing protein n=1 Tax=Anthocerotibacter panamensis TaxID=2857077 RepID=UPI001C407045|nr:exo-beta-N-acetylmuramidase NamZ domain-containing protein [Anthocerotibacter panamensis]